MFLLVVKKNIQTYQLGYLFLFLSWEFLSLFSIIIYRIDCNVTKHNHKTTRGNLLLKKQLLDGYDLATPKTFSAMTWLGNTVHDYIPA